MIRLAQFLQHVAQFIVGFGKIGAEVDGAAE